MEASSDSFLFLAQPGTYIDGLAWCLLGILIFTIPVALFSQGISGFSSTYSDLKCSSPKYDETQAEPPSETPQH